MVKNNEWQFFNIPLSSFNWKKSSLALFDLYESLEERTDVSLKKCSVITAIVCANNTPHIIPIQNILIILDLLYNLPKYEIPEKINYSKLIKY